MMTWHQISVSDRFGYRFNRFLVNFCTPDLELFQQQPENEGGTYEHHSRRGGYRPNTSRPCLRKRFGRLEGWRRERVGVWGSRPFVKGSQEEKVHGVEGSSRTREHPKRWFDQSTAPKDRIISFIYCKHSCYITYHKIKVIANPPN